jgi:hypothetical protein
MRVLKFIPIFILLSCLANKNVDRIVSIEVIGWRFALKPCTQFNDSSFDSKGKILQEIPTTGPSLKLFTIKDSSLGAFSAYLRKDTLKLQDWLSWHDKDIKRYFEQLKQLPDLDFLDNKYYTMNIDSVNFLVQYSKYIEKGKSDTIYSYHHYGKINDVELDISFWYNKSLTGKNFMEIIQNSKFGG